MDINIRNRSKILNKLKILQGLKKKGEALKNRANQQKYVEWRDYCETTLESSIGKQSFTSKFKSVERRDSSFLNDIELEKQISRDVNCLQSFYENIERELIGIWRAIGLDIVLLLNQLRKTVWEWLEGPIGILAFIVIVSFGLFFVRKILTPYPQVNIIEHDVECKEYGVCDKNESKV